MTDPNELMEPQESPVATMEEPEPVPVPKTANEKAEEASAKWKDVSDRQDLGRRICKAIRDGIAQRAPLDDRIKRNEELFENRNIAPPSLPWAGAPYFHVPFTQPRIEQRKAAIVSTITAPSPVFRYKHIGQQERVEQVEQAVQFCLEAIAWEQILDMLAQLALLSNTPIARVTFQEWPQGLPDATHTGPFCGPVVDAIHLNDFVCWPATSKGVANARVVGHRLETRRAEVTAAQKRKEYFDDVELGGADATRKEERTKQGDLQQHSGNAQEESDENIELWDVLWRDDPDETGNEKWYRCIVRLSGDVVLSIEDYPEDLPVWYFIGRIKQEYGELYTESSPAQDAQAMQLLLNATVNYFFWAFTTSMLPPVLAEGLAVNPGESAQYKPGTITPVKQLGKTQVIQSGADMQSAQVMIEMVRSFGDGALKTSDTMTGAPSVARDSTATEQNIKFQGFQLAGSADVVALSPMLCGIAKMIVALLGKYFESWKGCYKDAVEATSADIFKVPYTVELAGRSPEDAPDAQIAQNQQLMELAQNFPDQGIPVADVIKAIIEQMNLPNKEDILRAMEQHEAEMGMFQNFAQMMQAMGGAMPQGGQPNGGPPGIDMAALLGLGGMGGGPAPAPAGSEAGPAQPGNPFALLAGRGH